MLHDVSIIALGMINKNLFLLVRKDYYSKSRLFGLLYLMFICFWSCNQQEKNQIIDSEKNKIEALKEINQNDSLTFFVKFRDKAVTGFNIVDPYLHYFYLEFENPLERDTIVAKGKLITYDNEVLYYSGAQFVDGKIEFYKHYYLINRSIKNLEFEFKNGDIILKDNKEIFVADSVFIKYDRFSSKLNVALKESNYEDLEKQLDNIYNTFKDEFLSKGMFLASLLNDYQYYNKLQIINPLDNRIDNYLKRIDTIIAGQPLGNLIFFYTKNRINKFDYKKLNTKIYSKKYIKLLSIGVFNFLRHEDNKGDKKYQPALDWLKTTDLFKNDSIYIKKEITPINNEKFKEKLKNIELTDTKNITIGLKEIIKEHPSSSYLIDFWATWCAPCIQGVKTMNKMQLPKNVKVISISIDKEKDKQKWVKKTKELEQSVTYWIDEANDNTKEFMKFIEMQSIPRYILIDKDMNLIDQAFYHPQEPQFLPKLQDVKNHKYW